MMNRFSPLLAMIGIFLLATIASCIVLNRWIVTDIGLFSYGRVWQLYITYENFGFFRRGLLGTIFSITGFNSLFENEYVFAHFVHHIAIIIISALILRFSIKNCITNIPFIAGIAFSPALIMQSGYLTGALDVFVLIFAIINILFIKNIALFSFIIIAGALTHELFIFTIPAQFVALAVKNHFSNEEPNFRIFILPLFATGASIIVLYLWGTPEINRQAFESTMASILPNAAYQHGFWSGYFEISSSINENVPLSTVESLNYYSVRVLLLALPLLYVLLVIYRLLLIGRGVIPSYALAAASIAPLLVFLVATDAYRWIGMSVNMGLLLSLLIATKTGRTESRLNLLILPFCVFAPFGGGGLDRPFPMHQFLIERIIN